MTAEADCSTAYQLSQPGNHFKFGTSVCKASTYWQRIHPALENKSISSSHSCDSFLNYCISRSSAFFLCCGAEYSRCDQSHTFHDPYAIPLAIVAYSWLMFIVWSIRMPKSLWQERYTTTDSVLTGLWSLVHSNVWVWTSCTAMPFLIFSLRFLCIFISFFSKPIFNKTLACNFL